MPAAPTVWSLIILEMIQTAERFCLRSGKSRVTVCVDGSQAAVVVRIAAAHSHCEQHHPHDICDNSSNKGLPLWDWKDEIERPDAEHCGKYYDSQE